MAPRRAYKCKPFGSRCYTGVGSRETPQEVLEVMARIGVRLAWGGWKLRSGRAEGCDLAFELGAHHAIVQKQKNPSLRTGEPVEPDIFLPWPSFNGGSGYTALVEPTSDAMELARKYNPQFSVLSDGARKLHARNCHQVLGADLADPSEFLICWTPFGTGSGGTGQAIRIANNYGVPVYDLGHSEEFKLILEWLES